MGEKLIVGPISKGLKNNPLAFYIDNDAFPTLINAYQWRGRIKRKRGTSQIGRLNLSIGTTDGSGNQTITIVPNAINVATSQFIIGSVTYTDSGASNPVTLTNSSGSAVVTLNRSTGVLSVMGAAINSPIYFYPGNPVMGLEDLNLNATQFPGTIAFDPNYAYNISVMDPYTIYGVSFYKNPQTGTYAGYTAKSTQTRVNWNGADYRQFWTTNYQGALWTTNGIDIPFTGSTNGMQFKAITTVDNITGGPPAIANLTITNHGLVVGDFLFVNEVVTTTGINFQTGYVIAVVNANKVTVEFPNATIASNGTGGIAQYLTNTAIVGIDPIRWYDGDPTQNSGIDGWVNFSPPLISGSGSTLVIDDLPVAQYYLVGARVILPYKDRLLFFGPVVQDSSSNKYYLQDTVIYSQNGTPYYTASFTGSVTSAATTYNPILVPAGQTATASAYFEDVSGYGGFISAGVAQPILAVSPNEDTLIVGFSNKQSRFVYTGNDLVPFNFYTVNSELGSGSTFSVVTLDRGVLSVGPNGIIISNQVSSQRIDLDIPDQIFQFNLASNGFARVSAQRDFINEWIYFSYPDNEISYIYPNQTLLYNYRDQSWGLFVESYTTYGQFRKASGLTWATLAERPNFTWADWNTPWNSGDSTLFQPEVICGNTQGFVMQREEETDEEPSLYISNISSGTITSPNHCLNAGDYILITGAIGTISSQVNGKIFSVQSTTATTFQTSPVIPSGTYLGGGVITRLYYPYVQTKQFPTAWNMARKTRLGPQQYLFSTTLAGQITLLIFLSQDDSSPYNNLEYPLPVEIVPQDNVLNNTLVYSTVVYTCPESTNIGLTPANTNLQMVTAPSQQQIWHRMNTSLIGDTVQIGFTLNDSQMRSFTATGGVAIITAATNANPCVLTANNSFSANQQVQISGVVGMTNLNGNTYNIITANSTTITIDVDSTSFGSYVSGGIATEVAPLIQFSEIELHSFILDIQQSQVIA